MRVECTTYEHGRKNAGSREDTTFMLRILFLPALADSAGCYRKLSNTKMVKNCSNNSSLLLLLLQSCSLPRETIWILIQYIMWHFKTLENGKTNNACAEKEIATFQKGAMSLDTARVLWVRPTSHTTGTTDPQDLNPGVGLKEPGSNRLILEQKFETYSVY